MTTMTAPTSLENIEVRRIDGTLETMAKYRGQVLLIVNVASRCAFTKQYAGLESLYQEYRERGLVVMGFPCDQFGHQEPGDESTIQAFCSTTYNVSFPMFSKVEVNGPSAHPLFQFLTERCRGLLGMTRIQWNFTKFLVDRQGIRFNVLLR